MIILSYLGEAQRFDLRNGINLLAVRKPPSVIPEHFIHVPQLSPSKSLFSQTQSWKEQFDDKSDWWHLYTERFVKEMSERDDLVRAMTRLYQRARAGEVIRVFCFCKDVRFCHRYLIGKEMERRGCAVDYRYLKSAEPQPKQLLLF